jgi:hypothetical protein
MQRFYNLCAPRHLIATAFAKSSAQHGQQVVFFGFFLPSSLRLLSFRSFLGFF